MNYGTIVAKLRLLETVYKHSEGKGETALLIKDAADAIEELRKAVLRLEDESGIYDELPTFYIYPTKWIRVADRLPECEQEVLICTEKKLVGKDAYIDSIVTPAIYEDGTMPECDSMWHWEDIDYAGWDEENDCGIIPEGWWENRHFNPDEVYNNPVDRKVVAWMPLPEAPKDGEDINVHTSEDGE